MKQCSICFGAPPELRSAIDSMLQQHIPMKKIAEYAGKSKACIGRHSLKCRARATAKKHSSVKHCQAVLCWPTGIANTYRYFLGCPATREMSLAEVRHLDNEKFCFVILSYSDQSITKTAAADSSRDFPPQKLSRQQAANLKLEMESQSRPSPETLTEKVPSVTN